MNYILFFAIGLETITNYIHYRLKLENIEKYSERVVLGGDMVVHRPPSQTPFTPILRIMDELYKIFKTVTLWSLSYTVSTILPPSKIFFLINPNAYALVIFIAMIESGYRLIGRPVQSAIIDTSESLFYVGMVFTMQRYFIWLLPASYFILNLMFQINGSSYDNKGYLKHIMLLMLALFG